MGEQNTDNYRDDEIDLRKLFQAIGKGFSNIGQSIVNLIIRIRRVSVSYKILLIGMMLIGIVAGVLFNKIAKPYYNTSMLLSSEYFNGKLVENNINKLNALCEEEDRKGLAVVLNIDNGIAKNIRGFEFEPMILEQTLVDVEVLKQKLEKLKVKDPDIEQVIEQIEIQNKNTFIITVHVFDNTIIGNLQESLVGYFKNNPFVKNRLKVNKKNQLALIDKLKLDVAQLDSLKKLFNLTLKTNAGRSDKPTSNNVFLGESGTLDPVSFYTQGVKLYTDLQIAQEQVELGDDFEVIDGFTVFSKPESPGLIKTTVLSVLIFLGIGYLLIIFIESNKHLSRIEKERF